MKNRIKQTVLLASLLGLTLNAVAVERNHSIVLKTGSYTLSNSGQTLELETTTSVTYEDDVDSEFALEYEYRINERVGVGVEYIAFTGNFNLVTDETPPRTGSGETEGDMLMLNMRRYFEMGQHIKPYFGAGVGYARMDMSGGIVGDASGMGLQGLLGVKFPFDRFGLVAEYKLISSEPDDGAGRKVDLSGSGLFFGALVRF